VADFVVLGIAGVTANAQGAVAGPITGVRMTSLLGAIGGTAGTIDSIDLHILQGSGSNA
jgi:hypothetical protein